MKNETNRGKYLTRFGFSEGTIFLRTRAMRSKWILCIALGLAASAFAKDPKPYLTGKLMQMDSVQCGVAENDAQSLAGRTLATDSGGKQPQQLLCQEYVLQAERVTYRIRPRDEKHSVLLPMGEPAQFRMQKNKMLLRMEALDSKEHEYVVVSMAPRSDSSSADATSTRLNHLQ
jgi:hypothetical protein